LNPADNLEKLYFTIGEVSDELGVSPSLVRFWEKEFPQLKPRKTEGGTRKYSREDYALLKKIYQLVKEEGFTLAGAREQLKNKLDQPVDKEMIAEKLAEIKKFLIELKNNLA